MVSAQETPGPKRQIGYQQGSTGAYTEGGGDINFNVDQMSFIRFSTNIPKGATVNSATLVLNMVAKNDQAQSCFNRYSLQNAGDALKLTIGSTTEWTSRWSSYGKTSWNPSWTSLRAVTDSGGTTKYADLDITNALQGLVNRGDWTPGGGIVWMCYTDNENGSDMGYRANNDFLPRPTLYITWTYNGTTKTQVNLCDNNQFDTTMDDMEVGRADSALPYWYQNAHYGTWVDPANYGTFVRAASGNSRVGGRNAAMFTTATPPAANDKATGMYCQAIVPSNTPHIFNGWIYIPSNVTSRVDLQSVYEGGNHTITERNQWVPFCTNPVQHANSSGFGWLYFILRIFPPYTAGWQVFISEPGIYKSDFRMMPFNSLTPDTTIVDYTNTVTKQRGARQWVPRRSAIVSGSQKVTSTWTKSAAGLYYLAEPKKG